MEVINLNLSKTIDSRENLTLCLGFFDALHLGHLELIKCAKKLNGKVGVMTFSKNPRELINNCKCPIINNLEMKKEILESYGVDYLFILDLSWDILNLDPNQFINQILVPLKTKSIVCGFDYTFGKKRLGTSKDLVNCNLFDVHIVNEVVNNKQEKISSTLIHKLIEEGNIEDVNTYLTRPYQIRGEVKEGFHVGRTINYQTANIDNDQNFALPKNGVYATRIIIDGKVYNSMTNVGIHPTINLLNKPHIETYIFDFKGDIYNKNVKLLFYKKTRDEIKFDSLSDLKNQLVHDEKEIRNYFINLD